MMRDVIKLLWNFITHVQVLAVAFAFALMVLLSNYYMSNIERKHLLSNVENIFYNTQAQIEAVMLEPQSALGVIAENVRNMILRGFDHNLVSQNLTDISRYITEDNTLMEEAIAAYGYFDVFGGMYISGNGWTQPVDYVPQERPWYKAAVDANGSVGVTEPYYNLPLDQITMTFARRIFDDDGNPLGIVCIDMLLDRIREYAVNAAVSEGSYGILLDKNFDVLAHPIPERFLGRNLRLMNDGEAIVEILSTGQNISERKVWDYNRNESIGFFHRFDNGWYLAIIAYADKYYKSVNEIMFILVSLGTLLASALIAILLSAIASRKRAEERMKIMLDATPLCASFWDEDIKLIDCNKETVRLFLLTDKKQYIDNFYNYSPEYQPDGTPSKEKAVFQIKRAFDEGYLRFEWMHRSAQGEPIPSEVTLVRVKYRNGYLLAAFMRDLREMKAIMAKMREADECTQVLFDATPLSCFMFDKNYKILESNQEIARLFGLSDKSEFINKIYDFFPEYQPSGDVSSECLKKYIDDAFEEGYCRFEWMHQKLDGEQIPTEVSLVRVKFKGEYTVACYIRDLREVKAMIAEMRRAEIAEESNKAKSDFLAKMSHEIRTPMNAILGITEIQLQDDSLPIAKKEALERIYNSGDLLLGIINDILDLSKIEAGKLELIPVQYDIASLIHDTVKLNIMRYESKPIDFKLDVSENTPSTLIGDELRIKQILNNLLSNAFKYTQEGQIEFSLSSESPADKLNTFLVFRVSDTGQGMTADQVKKLGDKFSRFNLEANRKTEGTGLGMNITRNLIQLMNGDIYIESTPGMGSVFTVRLPQRCVNTSPIGKKLADNLMKLNLKNTTKMRNAQITQDYMPYGNVLVIDDVETNLYVARGLMAPYGITINTGLSGFEAIDNIRDGSEYDIIFMDHMMPRMDGIETVKIIRSLGYTKPIVALTANALSGQAEMFLNNGFDDFISKPIDIRQLNSILNKYIRDKQSPDVLDEARKLKNMLYAAGGHKIAIDPQLAEFFVRDAKKSVTVLNAICDNSCRRGDDIPTFIINVHAMKSALANVGESDLSNKASEMEQAGRDHNVNLILATLPDFIDSLNAVIEKLNPAEEDAQDEDIETSGDKSFMQERLQAIQSACASFDKRSAKEALTELKQKAWPRLIKDQLSAITEHLLHSEFEEAAAIAKNIYFN